jgi:hypothetical protein
MTYGITRLHITSAHVQCRQTPRDGIRRPEKEGLTSTDCQWAPGRRSSAALLVLPEHSVRVPALAVFSSSVLARTLSIPLITPSSRNGAVVLCSGAVVLWCCGAVVLWCCGLAKTGQKMGLCRTCGAILFRQSGQFLHK